LAKISSFAYYHSSVSIKVMFVMCCSPIPSPSTTANAGFIPSRIVKLPNWTMVGVCCFPTTSTATLSFFASLATSTIFTLAISV